MYKTNFNNILMKKKINFFALLLCKAPRNYGRFKVLTLIKRISVCWLTTKTSKTKVYIRLIRSANNKKKKKIPLAY